MQILQIDQRQSLSDLLQQYLGESLLDWTDYAPNMAGLESASSDNFMSELERVHLVKEWSLQYDSHSPRQALVNRIKESDVYTITTGHQLGLATGPAYTIYKIASAIALAKKCNAHFNDRRFIPVFWLASEDHDFEEINHFHTRQNSYYWNRDSGGPVGRMATTGALDAMQEWLNHLKSTGDQDTAELLIRAYNQSNVSRAFRMIIDHIFKDYELLIIDADHPHLKRGFMPIIRKELTDGLVHNAMKQSDQWFDQKGFQRQVNSREINVFYQTTQWRKRIVKNESAWHVLDTDINWSIDALESEIESHPENFSPNVTMRPLYQEWLLPNVAYIGGPGEINYWLQLLPVFRASGIKMPVLLLRDSALILQRNTTQRWHKWGDQLDMLTSSYEVEQKKMVQSEALDLTTTREAIDVAMLALKNDLQAIDPSLATAADMEWKKQLQGLDALEKKMSKVLRQRDEIKWQQLTKFFDEIRPNGFPQERRFNYLDLVRNLSQPILAELIDVFDPTQTKLTIVMDDHPNRTEG